MSTIIQLDCFSISSVEDEIRMVLMKFPDYHDYNYTFQRYFEKPVLLIQENKKTKQIFKYKIDIVDKFFFYGVTIIF